ncbi:TonB-dependent receptor [Stakelama marina]|uniref:TonB-dependent receptor n=1 Tax=Stakelama marina TaxID=2826939 RepID=A0A8T4IBZ5_9SPHN|nr:TonB-dependent receptor [Stakelama marina]MBR0552548.1 TonB-dependent receptor [Stakelama marina]
MGTAAMLALVAGNASAKSPDDAPPATGATAAQASEDAPASAQAGDNEIVVTATRRQSTVQDAPINIAAIGGDQLETQGITNLREVTQSVPGIYIPDTGARNGAPIVFRGLNADPLGSGDGNNSGGGTVATYVGEIPLYIDLRLNDMQRVEFLAGPQGTLYGAGTLGGAVRYIPNRPKFDATTVDVRGGVYGYSHGSDISYDAGATINLPLSPTLAFRGSFDRLNDTGFIDQPYVVNEIGVSNPDPNFTDPASVSANTHRVKDVNTDKVWSGRAALRWQPVDALDVNLTYYFQQEDTNGRQASSQVVSDFPVPVGKYENLKRVTEPNRRINHLLALEVSADLGFAELTSATGRSWFKDFGHRDQTDLLIGLEYSYEAFPNFTAFTTEQDHEETFTQEVRLVSQTEGPFSWIIGGFYNKRDSDGYSKEFTPHYSEYLVNDVGFPGPTRPDNLEYYSVGNSSLKELAGYGELSYQITPNWQFTAGGRYYHYDLKTNQAVDIPLFDTVTGGRGPNDVVLDYVPGGQKDSGFLYKFNTSWHFTPDAMVYATVSEGYRIGNSNGVAPCPDPLPTNQIVCALPNEVAYNPDKTKNYEIGVKTQWLDRKLTFNAAVYHIDWSDPQVSSATQNGLQPITINGSGARSNGMELLLAARPTPQLSLRATYAYTDPQLTDVSPNLVPYITPPGFQSTLTYADGEPGDRLPGSPKHSGTFHADYSIPFSGGEQLVLGYSFYGQSNVFTTTGARGNSYTLPGFTRSDISARLTGSDRDWSLTLYVNNVFNQFSQTGVAGSPNYNQTVYDDQGGAHYVRTFYTYVLPPRQFGVRFTKSFGK